jgi:hypothetical protein
MTERYENTTYILLTIIFTCYRQCYYAYHKGIIKCTSPHTVRKSFKSEKEGKVIPGPN